MFIHVAFCTDTCIAALMAEITPYCGLALGTANLAHSAKVSRRTRVKSHSTGLDVLSCTGTGCSCGGQTDALCGSALGAKNVCQGAELSWQRSPESRETFLHAVLCGGVCRSFGAPTFPVADCR